MMISFLEFRSKVDWWMSLIIWGCCVILVGAAILTFFDQDAGTGSRAVVVLISVVTTPFLIWIRFGTSYRLTENHLFVRSGPFRTTILLDSVISVEPLRSTMSGPSLSRDRFLIRYDRYATVLISPEDRGAFLDELAQRAPHLVWQDGKLAALS